MSGPTLDPPTDVQRWLDEHDCDVIERSLLSWSVRVTMTAGTVVSARRHGIGSTEFLAALDRLAAAVHELQIES